MTLINFSSFNYIPSHLTLLFQSAHTTKAHHTLYTTITQYLIPPTISTHTPLSSPSPIDKPPKASIPPNNTKTLPCCPNPTRAQTHPHPTSSQSHKVAPRSSHKRPSMTVVTSRLPRSSACRLASRRLPWGRRLRMRRCRRRCTRGWSRMGLVWS